MYYKIFLFLKEKNLWTRIKIRTRSIQKFTRVRVNVLITQIKIYFQVHIYSIIKQKPFTCNSVEIFQTTKPLRKFNPFIYWKTSRAYYFSYIICLNFSKNHLQLQIRDMCMFLMFVKSANIKWWKKKLYQLFCIMSTIKMI